MWRKTKLFILLLFDKLDKCIKAQVENKGAKTITLNHSTFERNSWGGSLSEIMYEWKPVYRLAIRAWTDSGR